MKKLTAIILIFFLSLLSSPSWSETLTMDDLVKRNDLFYKKFTDVPFTGKITGKSQGSFKDGKAEGEWVYYGDNGNLNQKGKYKDGLRVGEWVMYWDSGQLMSKGEYKNGLRVGEWVNFFIDGQLWFKGEWKNGKKVGEWVYYYTDGTGTISSKKTF